MMRLCAVLGVASVASAAFVTDLTGKESTACEGAWICPDIFEEVCGCNADSTDCNTFINRCAAICSDYGTIKNAGPCLDELGARNAICGDREDDRFGCQSITDCFFQPTVDVSGGGAFFVDTSGDSSATLGGGANQIFECVSQFPRPDEPEAEFTKRCATLGRKTTDETAACTDADPCVCEVVDSTAGGTNTTAGTIHSRCEPFGCRADLGATDCIARGCSYDETGDEGFCFAVPVATNTGGGGGGGCYGWRPKIAGGEELTITTENVLGDTLEQYCGKQEDDAGNKICEYTAPTGVDGVVPSGTPGVCSIYIKCFDFASNQAGCDAEGGCAWQVGGGCLPEVVGLNDLNTAGQGCSFIQSEANCIAEGCSATTQTNSFTGATTVLCQSKCAAAGNDKDACQVAAGGFTGTDCCFKDLGPGGGFCQEGKCFGEVVDPVAGTGGQPRDASVYENCGQIADPATCEAVGADRGPSIATGASCKYVAANLTTCSGVEGCDRFSDSKFDCQSQSGCQYGSSLNVACVENNVCQNANSDHAEGSAQRETACNAAGDACFWSGYVCVNAGAKILAEQPGVCSYDVERSRADANSVISGATGVGASGVLCPNGACDQGSAATADLDTSAALGEAGAGGSELGLESPADALCNVLTTENECFSARDSYARKVCEFVDLNARCHPSITNTAANDEEGSVLGTNQTDGNDLGFNFDVAQPAGFSIVECTYASENACLTAVGCVWEAREAATTASANVGGRVTTAAAETSDVIDCTGEDDATVCPGIVGNLQLCDESAILDKCPHLCGKCSTVTQLSTIATTAQTLAPSSKLCRAVVVSQAEICNRFSDSSLCLDQPECKLVPVFEDSGTVDSAVGSDGLAINLDGLENIDDPVIALNLLKEACFRAPDGLQCEAVVDKNNNNASLCEYTTKSEGSCTVSGNWVAQVAEDGTVNTFPDCGSLFTSEELCVSNPDCQYFSVVSGSCAPKPHFCLTLSKTECKAEKEQCTYIPPIKGQCQEPAFGNLDSDPTGGLGGVFDTTTAPQDSQDAILTRLKCRCLAPDAFEHLDKDLCEELGCAYFSSALGDLITGDGSTQSSSFEGSDCLPKTTVNSQDPDEFTADQVCTCVNDPTAEGCDNVGGTGSSFNDALTNDPTFTANLDSGDQDCGQINIASACDAKASLLDGSKLCSWLAPNKQRSCLSATESTQFRTSLDPGCAQINADVVNGGPNVTHCAELVDANGDACIIVTRESTAAAYCAPFDKCAAPGLNVEAGCNSEPGCVYQATSVDSSGNVGQCIADVSDILPCQSEGCCTSIELESKCNAKVDLRGDRACEFAPAASGIAKGACDHFSVDPTTQEGSCDLGAYNAGTAGVTSELLKKSACIKITGCKWDEGQATNTESFCVRYDPCLEPDLAKCAAKVQCEVKEVSALSLYGDSSVLGGGAGATFEDIYQGGEIIATTAVPGGGSIDNLVKVCVQNRTYFSDGSEEDGSANIDSAGSDSTCHGRFTEAACGLPSLTGDKCSWIESGADEAGEDAGDDVFVRSGSCVESNPCATLDAGKSENDCNVIDGCEWHRDDPTSVSGSCQESFSLAGQDGGGIFQCVPLTAEDKLPPADVGSLSTTTPEPDTTPTPDGCCYYFQGEPVGQAIPEVSCDDGIGAYYCDGRNGQQEALVPGSFKAAFARHYPGQACRDIVELPHRETGCVANTAAPTTQPVTTPATLAPVARVGATDAVFLEFTKTLYTADGENSQASGVDQTLLQALNAPRMLGLGLDSSKIKKLAGSAISWVNGGALLKFSAFQPGDRPYASALAVKIRDNVNDRSTPVPINIRLTPANTNGAPARRAYLNVAQATLGAASVIGTEPPTVPTTAAATTEIKTVPTVAETLPPTTTTEEPTTTTEEPPTSQPTKSPTVFDAAAAELASLQQAEVEAEAAKVLQAQLAAHLAEAQRLADEAAAGITTTPKPTTTTEAQQSVARYGFFGINVADDSVSQSICSQVTSGFAAVSSGLGFSISAGSISCTVVDVVRTAGSFTTVLVFDEGTSASEFKSSHDAFNAAIESGKFKLVFTEVSSSFDMQGDVATALDAIEGDPAKLAAAATAVANVVVAVLPGISGFKEASWEKVSRRTRQAGSTWRLVIVFEHTVSEEVARAATTTYNRRVNANSLPVATAEINGVQVVVVGTPAAVAAQAENAISSEEGGSVGLVDKSKVDSVADGGSGFVVSDDDAFTKAGATTTPVPGPCDLGTPKDKVECLAALVAVNDAKLTNLTGLLDDNRDLLSTTVKTTPRVLCDAACQRRAAAAKAAEGSATPAKKDSSSTVVIVIIVVVLLVGLGAGVYVYQTKNNMDLRADNAMSTYANPQYAAGGLPGAGLPGAPGGNLDVTPAAGAGGKLVRQESLC